MKKFLALALALLMLCGIFAGCGGDTPAADTEPPVVTTEAPVVTEPPVTTVYPAIPEELDYEAYQFNIFVNVHSTNYSDFDLKNPGYDVVNEAAFKRNTIVEEKLNITIEPYFASGSAFKGGPGLFHQIQNPHGGIAVGQEIIDEQHAVLRAQVFAAHAHSVVLPLGEGMNGGAEHVLHGAGLLLLGKDHR